MRCIRNASSIKHLYMLAVLLFVPALLLISACAAPAPSTPPTPPPPSTPANESPIISSLTAEEEVSGSSESPIACEASDADGDTLTYKWSANGGTIVGEGSNITWVAPNVTGNYTVRVTVADSKGGTATNSTTIAVTEKPNQPPVISGITINGNPPGEENLVKQLATTTLQCKAEDPDGDNLNYLWRASCGNVIGKGSTVSWVSTGRNEECTVTVMVNDGRDGKAEESIEFEVSCCGGF